METSKRTSWLFALYRRAVRATARRWVRGNNKNQPTDELNQKEKYTRNLENKKIEKPPNWSRTSIESIQSNPVLLDAGRGRKSRKSWKRKPTTFCWPATAAGIVLFFLNRSILSILGVFSKAAVCVNKSIDDYWTIHFLRLFSFGILRVALMVYLKSISTQDRKSIEENKNRECWIRDLLMLTS